MRNEISLFLLLVLMPQCVSAFGAGKRSAGEVIQSSYDEPRRRVSRSAFQSGGRPASGGRNRHRNKQDKAESTSYSPRSRQSDANEKRRGMHQLMKMIFDNYDKELIPSRPVLVKLDVLLLKVRSTVEKEGIFESVIALFIEWFDSRMTWDPLEYDNVSVLAFDSERVWLPDIAMTNSADHLYAISRDTRFVVRVNHNGLFKFVPTGTAKTWCDLNLVTFPFDSQTVRILIPRY